MTKKQAKQPKFTQWGDSILSTPTQQVSKEEILTPEFQETLRHMIDDTEDWSVGLAANQIGVGKRFAVVTVRPTRTRPGIIRKPVVTIVNPTIVGRSDELQYCWEGCMSSPSEMMFFIPRAKWVEVEYIDGFTAKPAKRRFEGFEAIVVQHEIDHLDGNSCQTRVLFKNGSPVKGAVITREEYMANQYHIPEGAKSFVREVTHPEGTQKES